MHASDYAARVPPHDPRADHELALQEDPQGNHDDSEQRLGVLAIRTAEFADALAPASVPSSRFPELFGERHLGLVPQHVNLGAVMMEISSGISPSPSRRSGPSILASGRRQSRNLLSRDRASPRTR